MDTEDIFATEDVEIMNSTLIEAHNSQDKDDESSNEDSDSDSSNHSWKPDEDFLPSQELTQLQERTEIIKNLPRHELFSQQVLKFGKMNTIDFYTQPPKPKQLTQEELAMLEVVKNNQSIPKESTTGLFPRNDTPKIETIPAIKSLIMKEGFISAQRVHTINLTQATQEHVALKQTEHYDDSVVFPKGFLTQAEDEATKNFQQDTKRVTSPAAAVIEDFDNLDYHELTLIEDESNLNHSLCQLSQALQSVKAVELINSSVSRKHKVDLDVTFIDLETLPEDVDDEPEIADTENLEDLFLNFQTQVPKEKIKEEPAIAETEELELDFLDLETQQDKKMINKLDISFINNAETKNQHFGGFGFASGKSVVIKNLSRFENAFKNKDKLITSELVNEDFNQIVKPPSHQSSDDFTMFTTPETSRSSLKRNREAEKPIIRKIEPSSLGFASAAGGKIALNQDYMRKFAEKFAQEDELIGKDLQSGHFLEDEGSNTPRMSKAKKLHFDELPGQSAPNITSRFKTDLNNLEQSSTSFDDFTALATTTPVAPKFVGFGFASGQAVATKNLSAFQNAFASADKQITSELSNKSNQLPGTLSSVSKVVKPVFTPESSRPLSRANLKRKREDDKECLQPECSFTIASGAKAFIKDSSKIAEKFAREDKIIENNLNEENVLEDIDTVTPCKPKAKRIHFEESPLESSPFMMTRFKSGINQHSTPFNKRLNKNTKKITESQDVASIIEMFTTLDDSELGIEASQKEKITVQSRSGFEDCHKLESQSIDNEIEVPQDVKEGRRQALNHQKLSIDQKPLKDKTQQTGSVFKKKSESKRLKMRDLVDSVKPVKLERHNVNLQNAIDFKFEMKNFVNEEVLSSNTSGIQYDNLAPLIMNENSRVGIDEIASCFLLSPGVDPKLAKRLWIENTFKMVVLKLAWLENSFVKFNKFELLTPEQLLTQMKYRYDREIDRSHRPALKKIMELDDVPCRRMVLKVLEVSHEPRVGFELQLSDGWYSIKGIIDASLADAVTRNMIEVGTKLIISNAEIIGCGQGCDPLEANSGVRLKIHTNSTRKTTWDAKLGFCQDPRPFRISLDSLLAFGGVIGKLVVVVTHVYPLMYVDSSKEQKEFRSEKLQRRMQNKLDVLNFQVYETVAYQVQQEMHRELQDRVKDLKIKTNFDDCTAEEVCDLLDSGVENEKLMKKSVKMRERLESVRQERRQDMNVRVRKKLGEQSRQVSQMLKFRVVDAKNPKKTALISCWKVDEDLLSVITQGAVLEITNATVGAFGNEIQVTAGKSCSIRSSKSIATSSEIVKFFRKETKISEIHSDFKPSNDEFDVTCMIVLVETRKVNNFVKVYVTDEDFNLLCLNFWSSLSENAFDDVVVEGQILYVINLQWRYSHVNEKVPQAFIKGETTLLLSQPMNKMQRCRLEDFNRNIGKSEEFLVKAKEKLSQMSQSDKVNKENQEMSTIRDISNTDLEMKQEQDQKPVMSRSLGLKFTPSFGTRVRKPRLGIHSYSIPKKETKPKKLNALQKLALR